MDGSNRADTTAVKHRKRSRMPAASSGVLRKKVMMSRIPHFFRHSHASQNCRRGLYAERNDHEAVLRIVSESMNHSTEKERKSDSPYS